MSRAGIEENAAWAGARPSVSVLIPSCGTTPPIFWAGWTLKQTPSAAASS